ncbi:uncharacterized protein LOC109704808, partial [Ananas comosus]|uniref:Uncharacterized protein LOC109704808 n=1 Tax=Ananas comosus TaxID=4615 RepID=A0A6P5EI11_ANACO
SGGGRGGGGPLRFCPAHPYPCLLSLPLTPPRLRCDFVFPPLRPSSTASDDNASHVLLALSLSFLLHLLRCLPQQRLSADIGVVECKNYDGTLDALDALRCSEFMPADDDALRCSEFMPVDDDARRCGDFTAPSTPSAAPPATAIATSTARDPSLSSDRPPPTPSAAPHPYATPITPNSPLTTAPPPATSTPTSSPPLPTQRHKSPLSRAIGSGGGASGAAGVTFELLGPQQE